MEYKHFSHQHNLSLSKVQEGQHYRCHGCHTWCYDSIYACWKCKFFLHEHCGNANRYVKHPAHALHPLILMPTPTYCSGSFVCNACGVPGNSFSYCCALCEIDLHLNCAFLPQKVSHKAHQHELYISFAMPDQQGSAEYCKLCSKELNSKHWSFCCKKSECDFRVHTFCVTTEVKPGIYTDDGPETEAPVASSTSGASNTNASQTESYDQPQQTGLTAENIAELYELRLQMQMAEQLAQMMASVNLSNLV